MKSRIALLTAAFLLIPSIASAGGVHTLTGAFCVGTDDEDDISRQFGAADASNIDLYCPGWGVTTSSSTVDASNVDVARFAYNDGDGAPHITASFCLGNADDLSQWACSGTGTTCSPYGCAAAWWGSGIMSLSAPTGSYSSAHNMYLYVTLPGASRVVSYRFESY